MKLAIIAGLESCQNIAALVAARSILIRSGAAKKVAALVARATFNGASHSSGHNPQGDPLCNTLPQYPNRQRRTSHEI